MTKLPEHPHYQPFRMQGFVMPLWGMEKAVQRPGGEWVPTRPLGGWLCTYGKVGPDGGIVPTVDRDGHVFEAAGELNRIDWAPYAKGGRWNDTHATIDGRDGSPKIIVGWPLTLEFHDGNTPLAKAHGKVGFWTTGWLFDHDDPQSWISSTGEPYQPSALEFGRADHFWGLTQVLKGTPRPIGLSAEGLMALSPCRKRIIFARVTDAAVCELPKNPDATLEAMELSARGMGLVEFLRKGMVGGRPCGACRCPAGACQGLVKAVSADSPSMQAVAPQDLEGGPRIETDKQRLERLVGLVMERFHVSREDAIRWIKLYARKSQEDGHAEDSHAR